MTTPGWHKLVRWHNFLQAVQYYRKGLEKYKLRITRHRPDIGLTGQYREVWQDIDDAIVVLKRIEEKLEVHRGP